MSAGDGFVRATHREHVTVSFQASGEVWLPSAEPGEFEVRSISCVHAHGSPQAAKDCAEKIGARIIRQFSKTTQGATR